MQSECKGGQGGVNAYIWAPNKCQRMHTWMQKCVEEKKIILKFAKPGGSVESKISLLKRCCADMMRMVFDVASTL